MQDKVLEIELENYVCTITICLDFLACDRVRSPFPNCSKEWKHSTWMWTHTTFQRMMRKYIRPQNMSRSLHYTHALTSSCGEKV